MGEPVSYDAAKDRIEWQRDLEPDGKTGIEFSVCRYDTGPQKVKLQRYGIRQSGERYYLPKLGRISMREMVKIVEAFNEWRRK
jgi:hypothetical protein